MCYLSNSGVSNIKLDDSDKADLKTAKVVAHEIAHMMGVEHDGDTPKSQPTLRKWDNSLPRYFNKKIPCPDDTHIMGPTQLEKMKEWSKCTQQQVDDEDKLRVKLGLDCLSVG